MEYIELSGAKYPIRFDFRALKEFKALTKSDVLKGFDAKDTDNLIVLTYVGLKSGFYFANPSAKECPITEEDISRMVAVSDMVIVISAFMKEVHGLLGSGEDNETPDKPGEIPGIASSASSTED